MALSCCKKSLALLRGIISKDVGDFYLKYLYVYRTKNKFKKYENVCENHDYCYAEMPNEDNQILKYNHGKINKSYISYLCRLRVFT